MDIISLALLLGATLITLGASSFIRVNYNKFKKIGVSSKMTGYDVAREILDRNGLSHILIIETSGELSDHYDPSKKVVKLSKEKDEILKNIIKKTIDQEFQIEDRKEALNLFSWLIAGCIITICFVFLG